MARERSCPLEFMRLQSRMRTLATAAFGSGNPLRDFALRTNYFLGRYHREVIWVVGDGRSGTTWLSSMINWHGRYREMFEPFHPVFVPTMRSLRPFQYVRVGFLTPEFRELVDIVFSGRLRDERVDMQTPPRLHHGLVVKDIFTQLFAAAVLHEFPEIKLVLIIRNPIDVALSKLKLRRWWWPDDPQLFLAQQNLMEDYLHPFEAQIAHCSGDFVTRQVMIWAILHYVLLKQRPYYRAHVVFYESLRIEPERELSKLFQFLQTNTGDNGTSAALLNAVNKPSRMTRVGTGKVDPRCSAQQLSDTAEILATFGLDHLYDNDRKPTQNAAELATRFGGNGT
jgi:Sulfotransferase domain